MVWVVRAKSLGWLPIDSAIALVDLLRRNGDLKDVLLARRLHSLRTEWGWGRGGCIMVCTFKREYANQKTF